MSTPLPDDFRLGCLPAMVGAAIGFVLTWIWAFNLGGISWMTQVLLCAKQPHIGPGDKCGDGIELVLPGGALALGVMIVCAVLSIITARLVNRYRKRSRTPGPIER